MYTAHEGVIGIMECFDIHLVLMWKAPELASHPLDSFMAQVYRSIPTLYTKRRILFVKQFLFHVYAKQSLDRIL